MATMTFQINDASTSSGGPAVWVSITENADGTLSFNVWQEGGIIGDLRGVFFDMADESILKSLVITAASTDIRIGDDSIKDLGDGANMLGLLGSDKGYDVGIEIGTSGIGKDDIQSYTFTLDSTARDLKLSDFANVDFAARLTSVGVVGGTRADSSKILEITSKAADATNDLATVDENQTVSGNVLDNDTNGGGTTTITGWSGGAVGVQVALSSEGDIIGTVQLNADGSYTVDASAADELSAGESIVYNFNYDIRNQTEATSYSTDTATFTVVINGKNDGPVADDDNAGSITEDEIATGTTRSNDSDIDRLDSISVTALNGIADGAEGDLDADTGSIKVLLASGALVTMNADGTFSYDTNGAFEDLNNGDAATDSFVYTLADNHGATDDATVSLTITGVTDGNDGDEDDGTGGGGGGDRTIYTADDSYPTFQKDISHAVLVFATTSGDKNNDGYYTVKIDGYGGDDYTVLQQTDLDASIDDILAWLVANDANIDADTVFLGAQIKGGNVGTASDSYDDYWENDGDNTYTIETITKDSGHGTTTEWVSGDEAPVDMSQDFQNKVDKTYLYDNVMG